MKKTELVNVRLDKDLKKESEAILSVCGMNLSTAINVFLHQLVIQRGIPFLVTLNRQRQQISHDINVDEPMYNQETIDAMKEDVSDCKSYDDVDEMFKELTA